MSKPCPLYGKAIYLDCLECEDKPCKSAVNAPKETDAMRRYKKHAQQIQRRSKIFQIIRKQKPEIPYSVGMVTDGFDCPYSYSCLVFGYEITSFSRCKAITVYKRKFYSDIRLNLHHHFYVSPNAPSIFKEQCIEPISQETLAKLANKDWTKGIKGKAGPKELTPLNAEMLRIMQRKYILTLVYHKQIVYSHYSQKYIAYDYCEYCKQNGWRV